jgi:transposase
MLPVLEHFKHQYQIPHLVIIADAGLLSHKNIAELIENQYEFIIGARLKNETDQIKNQILSYSLFNGDSTIIEKQDGLRLIVNYSEKRSKKDLDNRKRGLKKLESALLKGKLGKKHINNRGYNKYLKLEGNIQVSIDYVKFEFDSKWDGLKGYITNTQLDPTSIIEHYRELWNIEKAFRISKTDLRIRPIYHRLEHRIEAHICISFTAYKIYKELERRLKDLESELSVEKAIDILKTIYGIEALHPETLQHKTLIFAKREEQINLLNLFNIRFGCAFG